MPTVTPFNTMLDRMATLSRAMDDAMTVRPGTVNWMPSLDAYETDQAYVVTVDLPGVAREAVDISFERNTLTMKGTRERSGPPGDKEARVFFREREWGSFERSLRFPHFVDGEKISAAFANGVLTITVPKSESALPRRIAIG
jgi:HSP20 family protein